VSRPQCPDHPDGRVRKQGRYGKNKQYQRWQCVPPDGDRPHLFRPTLPRKQVGGTDGDCFECGRPWEDGDGMPTAVRDRYTLRDKAATLLKLAEGHSYRDASQFARIRANQWTEGENGERVFSRDGRLAGDWVAQYADIVASPELPDTWPSSVLVLDHITLKNLDTAQAGEPKQGGKVVFHVFGAMSYESDAGVEKGRRPKSPKLHALRAFETARNEEWIEFFDRLDGKPAYVVCDAHRGLTKALRERWPDVPVYPCVYHLYRTARRHVRRKDLGNTELAKRLSKESFYREEPFEDLCYLLDQLQQEQWGGLTAKQRKGVDKIDSLVERTQAGIQRRIDEPRYPLSTGALERALRRVKNHLYDRRNVLRNMERLDELLALMAVRQRGAVDVRMWAKRLRHQHRDEKGRPPPRRVVDDPELAPQ